MDPETERLLQRAKRLKLETEQVVSETRIIIRENREFALRFSSAIQDFAAPEKECANRIGDTPERL